MKIQGLSQLTEQEVYLYCTTVHQGHTGEASPLPAAIATILCCLLLAAQFLVLILMFKDVWQIYLQIRPPSGNVGLLHR